MPGPSCGQRAMTACVFPPSALEITDYSGRVQSFIIKWAKTSFGRHRPILLRNSCGRGAIRLFFRYCTDACRFCHRALYASQKNNRIGHKRLQASKLRLTQLGGWPDINEPMPSKLKWTRRRTYQRIRDEIQALEVKAKTQRYRKPPAPGFLCIMSAGKIVLWP